MSKISIIFSSRKKGNKNHNLIRLLDTLENNVADPSNLEVIIKKDDCDDEFDYKFNYSYSTMVLTAPRWRGYQDIHLGVQHAIKFIDIDTKIVGIVSDDCYCVLKNFDKILLNEYKKYSIFRNISPEINIPLNKSKFDEFPFFSRDLLDVCNDNFIIYATDAWAGILEKNINSIGVYIPKIFYRPSDDVMSEEERKRYGNIKLDTFDFLESYYGKNIIRNQADNIKARMKYANTSKQ